MWLDRKCVEQTFWKSFIELIHFFAGGAASFNHSDIETLEMEEKNLVKYYLNDLKLARGGEELREKINSLHQTLVTAYAWKLYQEQMMDTDQFELLANNQKPVFSKVESKQIEDSFNKTDSKKSANEEL